MAEILGDGDTPAGDGDVPTVAPLLGDGDVADADGVLAVGEGLIKVFQLACPSKLLNLPLAQILHAIASSDWPSKLLNLPAVQFLQLD